MSTLQVNTWKNLAGTKTLFPCIAWVNFNGATGAIRASGNVASVTRSGVGIYVVNMAVAASDINYSIEGNMSSGYGVSPPIGLAINTGASAAKVAPTVTQFSISCIYLSGPTQYDPEYVNVSAHGNY